MINQPTPASDPEAPVFNGHRGELHTSVFEYARDELNIPIHLGRRIEKYFEDDNEAGIVLENGEKVSWVCHKLSSMSTHISQISADVVLGSDGVRSKARKLVLGYVDRPKVGIAFLLHVQYLH